MGKNTPVSYRVIEDSNGKCMTHWKMYFLLEKGGISIAAIPKL